MRMTNLEAIKLALVPGRLEAFEKQAALGEKEFGEVARTFGEICRGLQVLRNYVYTGLALTAIAAFATALSIWTVGALVGTMIFARSLFVEMRKFQSIENKDWPAEGITFHLPVLVEKKSSPL